MRSTPSATAWSIICARFRPVSKLPERFGILLPNNQRQPSTLQIQKNVLPYSLCQSLCPVSAAPTCEGASVTDSVLALGFLFLLLLLLPYYPRAWSRVIKKSMSIKYEPSSESLRISPDLKQVTVGAKKFTKHVKSGCFERLDTV